MKVSIKNMGFNKINFSQEQKLKTGKFEEYLYIKNKYFSVKSSGIKNEIKEIYLSGELKKKLNSRCRVVFLKG